MLINSRIKSISNLVKEKTFIQYLLYFVLFGVILLLIIYPYRKIFDGDFSAKSEDWGNFGDYLAGTLGVVFAFGSILVLVQTYKNQIKLNYVQSFESSFFNLLNNQKDIVKNCKISDYIIVPKDHDGYQGIKIITEEYIRRLGPGVFEDEIDGLYNKYSFFLSHYYRHIFQILKYIDEAQLTRNEKLKYSDILQAQMNSNELFLCLINCETEKGFKFLEIAKEFNFFENLHGIEHDGDMIVRTMIGENRFKGLKFKYFIE